MVHIGSGAVINGDLTGNEDVMFEGTLTGEFIASEATLTVGKTGQVDAALRAPRVVVMGTVNGTITGRERIELQATAVVKGDLSAPLVVAECHGARAPAGHHSGNGLALTARTLRRHTRGEHLRASVEHR
jgi:cytoskeletal protein CcmA (bactofilin family)